MFTTIKCLLYLLYKKKRNRSGQKTLIPGQSSKLFGAIKFNDDGNSNSTFVKFLHPSKAPSWIILTEVGIFTYNNDVHKKKAFIWIRSTDDGISTRVNEKHELNAFNPIVLTENGISTSFNDLHSLNVFLFISVTDDGIFISVNFVHPSKQPSGS